ncbi:MAG: S8 family serine peptidase [Lachnospiraceae bacterium]|nr:S8 family serine peptidase [Lachnospiraceae bacterium]
MKRAKLLSLFLAGSLLFQTAGIDAMATAPSEPAPISETVEDVGSDLSGQPAEEESGLDESTEESNPEQPSEGEESKDPAGEEETPEQPSESEEDKDPAGEEEIPEQPSEDEEDKDPAGEEETPEQPSEGEESKEPVEEDDESQDSVSENTVSENTISENTLPENETSIFSIFPGLGDNYKFSSQQLSDKRVLASHVEDVVQIQSAETATIEDYQDAEGEYEPGEVVYLAETREEAEMVAEAFGGTLGSYVSEVAVIRLPKKATVALAIAAASEPEIKLPAVWPNYYNYLYTDTNATVNPVLPAGYDEQWHHDYIGTRYAWAAGYKGQGIEVAVIDTGLTKNHEDLAANALNGKTYVDGANGTEFNADNDTHGTHVAGIIAADDNNVGVVGIAPDAQVRGYSVFAADGRCTTAWIMSAIRAAVKDGNDIINMSLGSPNYNKLYEDTVKEAYEKGVAIFAASGNDDSNGNNFPAAYASTISVGAVDENSTRASFSCYGSTVTLSFPGVNIYSTVPDGYGNMSGTSMACPAAAGTAAVILSAREDIKSKEGKGRVDALVSAMKSSTTKCANSGMGAGTTYLPGVLKLATDMTAPDAPVIDVVDENTYKRGANKKDYIAESVGVTLSSATAVGIDIYYSTSGKTPAYKNGVITNADNEEPYQIGSEIELGGAKSITIKAIAVNPITGMASKAASKTVTLTPIPSGVSVESASNVKRVVAGKSLKFTATVTPSYAISNKVEWSVDDKAKAAGITVSNGTVKTKSGTAPGEYTVTARAVGNDGIKYDGAKDDFKFTVIETSAVTKVAFIDPTTSKAPKAKSIKTSDNKTADDDNAVIDLGKYLTVTTTDTNKVKKDITGESALAEVVWSSSNVKIATVSDAGVISAVAPGKATIKATSNDGGNKSASYSVTVVQPVTEIIIAGSPKVAAGKGIALTAKVLPANASNKKVEWSVAGDGKVKIGKGNGKITTTKDAKGTYTVTAIAADKLGVAKAATYEITITDEEITKIILNESKLTLFPPKTSATKNTTATLTATVTGKKGGATQTLTDPLITWTSSAPSIASVDKDGNITAKSSGKATITCAATDGSNKKATCAVTVSAPMSRLVIGPTDGSAGCIAVGKKTKMVAKYYSNYGKPTSNKINWEIVPGSCKNVAADKVSIDKNGTVSVAKDATYGSFAVRATAQDGSGVTSNQYTLAIWPSFVAARLKKVVTTDDNGNINGYHFIVEATDEKDNKGKPDWDEAMMLPSFYCTATVSGPKNIGLYKDYLVIDGASYALYDPQPLKATDKQLDYLPPRGNVQLYTNECDKITLTVALKDGSNLKATASMYAIQYQNTAGYYVIGYY